MEWHNWVPHTFMLTRCYCSIRAGGIRRCLGFGIGGDEWIDSSVEAVAMHWQMRALRTASGRALRNFGGVRRQNRLGTVHRLPHPWNHTPLQGAPVSPSSHTKVPNRLRRGHGNLGELGLRLGETRLELCNNGHLQTTPSKAFCHHSPSHPADYRPHLPPNDSPIPH